MWVCVELLNPCVVGLRGGGILASDHHNLLLFLSRSNNIWGEFKLLLCYIKFPITVCILYIYKCHAQTWQGEVNSQTEVCVIMRFSDSNQRSGWGHFQTLGNSSVTVEWVCKQSDSFLRVLEEGPINTFVLAWRGFKRAAVAALHSGHLINSQIQDPWHLHFLSVPSPDRCQRRRGWRCSTQFTFRFLSQSERWDRDVCRRVFLGFIQTCGNMVKTPYQLSGHFVAAELSYVRVLPKDVEGDATFSLQLINLLHPSSSPRGQLTLSEEGERKQLIALYICAHLSGCVCKSVTTGGDKFCTLQQLSPAVDLDLLELLCSAALGEPKSCTVFKDS